MTITVQNTALSSTFDFLRNRTNELAYAMSHNAVTTGGDTATGDAAISGQFTAGSIVTGSLNIDTSISTGTVDNRAIVNSTAIGLVNTTANVFMTIPTPAQIANGEYFLNANSSWSLVPLNTPISNNQFVTTGTGFQMIDSYSTDAYNGAEYLFNTTDNTANGYSISRVLTYHDTGSAYTTEYSTMFSNVTSGVLNTFSANVDSNTVRIWAKPTRTSTKIKFVRVIV